MNTFLIILLSMMSSVVKNPVKLSMILLIMSLNLFMLLYVKTGTSWFPMIFFLVFMGGILMMFMILSSILPNEKSTGMKNTVMKMFLGMMILLNWKKITSSNLMLSTMMLNKSFLDSSKNMTTLTTLMMLYFFLSILMVSKESMPLRTKTCP